MPHQSTPPTASRNKIWSMGNQSRALPILRRMTNGGRITAKLAQWRGAWLRRRIEPEWAGRRRAAAVNLSLLLTCIMLAFGLEVVATAIVAMLTS